MAYAIEPGAVIHGDCLNILKQMQPESVDAIITDPPYSSGGLFRGDRQPSTREKYTSTSGKRGATQSGYAQHSFTGDNLDQRAWTLWAAEWLALAYDVTKPGGIAAVFVDWRQLCALCDAIQWSGWVWRGILVWDKENARPQPGRPTVRIYCLGIKRPTRY